MVLIDVPTAAVAWNVHVRSVRRWLRTAKLANHGQPGAPLVDLYADFEKSPAGRKRKQALDD